MPTGVRGPSSASEGFDSHEDTLLESMLSPELPLAADLSCSLVGELPGATSSPRKSLWRTWDLAGKLRHPEDRGRTRG